MPSFSIQRFSRQYDLDLIIASRASIAVGDLVWDVAGPIPPKLSKPGMPRNIFNALETIGQIDETQREGLQKQATDIPIVDAGLANISVHLAADHAGDFQYPGLVDVSTKIDIERISSFNFARIGVRTMHNSMRMATDRHLDAVKRNKWHDYDLRIRRACIITELYYGSVSVTLNMKLATDADVAVLTANGFKLAFTDNVNRAEVYSMDVNGVPFAMRTELARRFAA